MKLRRVTTIIAFVFYCCGFAECARATISATATSSTYMGSSGVSSFTLNRPSVINVGDLLLVQIALNNGSNSSATTVTAPTGWTQVTSSIFSPYGGTYLQQLIFSRVATATDTASGATSWSLSRSATTAASMTAYHSSTSGYTPTVGTTVFGGSGPNTTGVTSSSLSATSGQTIVRFASETLSPNTMQSGSSPALTTDLSINSGSWALYIGHRAYSSGSQTDLIKNVSIVAGVYMATGVLLSESPGASTVDHYEFTYTATGVTCEAQSITIKACTDSACSSLASTSSSVTLSASSGTLSANPVSFTGSTSITLRQNTPATVTFSVSSATPGATNTNTCNGTASSSCSLTFANAGFTFDVPNLTANKPSGAITLRAVKNAGDVSNSCVALFQNTTQSVNFWSGYNSPASGTKAVEIHAGSGGSTYTNVSGNSGAPTALSLTFDASGQTTFETRYQDAGQVTLNASYTGTGTYAGVSLAGSDSFISAPAGLCVRAATAAAPTTYLSCTANYSSCPAFAKAGNAFALNIAAVAWESDADTDFCSGNSTTPNYAQSNIALSSQLMAPSGGNSGALSPTTASITSGGTVTLSTATESEVGAFNFIATPPSYLGITIPAGIGKTVGRFIPDHFALVSNSGALTNRSTNCMTPPAFTYLGETLNLGFQLNALNASNSITQNYQGVFANLTTFAQLNIAAIAGSPRTLLTVASAGTLSLSWSSGVATVSTPVSVAKTATTVGPYTGTAFGIAPVDSDNVAAASFNLDTDATADAVNDHIQIGASTELRYGRLRLDSVSGSATSTLTIPATAQYWNGAAFVTNSADSNCTELAGGATALGNYRGSLGSGETTASVNGSIVSGQSSALQLSAPGSGNEGSVDVTLTTTTWPWLQFDWNADGTLDNGVTATANFGSYRGSDRVIYWQETQ